MRRWLIASSFFITAIMMALQAHTLYEYGITMILFITAFIVTQVIFYPDHPLGDLF